MTTEISSFAVFDLETTTIPDLNFNKANITEISIHGINAEDVSKAVNCRSPRINHKLTLLFNPLMVIEPKSEDITGLNNYILEHESKFDNNAAIMILNFLKHLRQPVCLVAHNGNSFDFPILKHAFSKLGLELPENTLCLDSLVAFKDLDLAKEAKNEFVIPLPNSDLIEGIEELVTPLKENQIEPKVEDETNLLAEDSGDSTSSTDIPEKKEPEVDWQKFNETTPKRPPNLENIERRRKRQANDESHSTPTEPSSRKSLNFGSTPSKTLRYNLGSIHERVFGHPSEIVHHAEADVVSLEKIILSYGKSFVDYAMKNAKPFSEVKRLGAK